MDNRKGQKRFHHYNNNNNHPSSSIALMIPDDSVREILIRLPDLRHVIRCASACKHWLSLASDPSFYREFARRHVLSATALFLQTRFDYPGGRWSEYDHKFYRIRNPDDANLRDDSSFKPFGHEDKVIRASFEDYLLVTKPIPENDYFPNYPGGKVPLKFYITKPFALDNRRRRRLPPLPRVIDRLLGCGLVCYDGGRHFAAAVFCRLPTEVRLNLYLKEATYVTVFSSEAGRWGPPVAVEFPDGAKMLADMPVVGLDGRLYSLLNSGCVMSMDPTEAFAGGPRPRSIPLPDHPAVCLSYLRIGACRGRIRLAAALQGVLRVWDLTSSYDWSLVYDESIEDMKIGQFRILALHPTNPDVVFVQFEFIYVVRYDMSRHKGEIIGKYPSNERVRGEVSTYALSLPSS